MAYPTDTIDLIQIETFSMDSAILTVKQAGLASRNSKRFVFLRGNLHFLKWQRVAEDEFDDMPSASCR